MPCRTYTTKTKYGEVQTHICFKEGVEPPDPCSVCGGMSDRLCDWPVHERSTTCSHCSGVVPVPVKGKETCDAPLCEDCSIVRGEDDFCPRHFAGAVHRIDGG